MGSGIALLVSDFAISFMWVWSGFLIKIFVFDFLRFEHDLSGEVFKTTVSIVNMFIFALLSNITHGGAYNPLTVLSSVVYSDSGSLLFTIGARIPAQVVGSVVGFRQVIVAYPQTASMPHLLNIDMFTGALTEGLLAFAIVVISLALSREMPHSFFRKTWITSLSKCTLNILGSDLTGGCMNPATVLGWAFANGYNITKEYVIVYWVAPMVATVLAAQMIKLLDRPSSPNEHGKNKEL